MNRFRNSLLLSYIYNVRLVAVCRTVRGSIGTAGITPRGRDGRDLAGDYRGYKDGGVWGKTIGMDYGGWPQTAGTRDDRLVHVSKE